MFWRSCAADLPSVVFLRSLKLSESLNIASEAADFLVFVFYRLKGMLKEIKPR